MSGKNKNRIELWRVIAFVFSVALIVFLWARKDIVAIYSTVSPEQALPMVITTIVVSLCKVAAIAGAVFLIKWIVGKVKKQ